MTQKPAAFDPEAVLDAMAALLGLPVKPEYRPGIVANLIVTAGFAALVVDADIEDDAEPAPVFTA